MEEKERLKLFKFKLKLKKPRKNLLWQPVKLFVINDENNVFVVKFIHSNITKKSFVQNY